MTRVACGLVDHVHKDPACVDRPDPKRWDRCDLIERVAPTERRAASLARRRVQLDDAGDAVTGAEPQ